MKLKDCRRFRITQHRRNRIRHQRHKTRMKMRRDIKSLFRCQNALIDCSRVLTITRACRRCQVDNSFSIAGLREANGSNCVTSHDDKNNKRMLHSRNEAICVGPVVFYEPFIMPLKNKVINYLMIGLFVYHFS